MNPDQISGEFFWKRLRIGDVIFTSRKNKLIYKGNPLKKPTYWRRYIHYEDITEKNVGKHIFSIFIR